MLWKDPEQRNTIGIILLSPTHQKYTYSSPRSLTSISLQMLSGEGEFGSNPRIYTHDRRQHIMLFNFNCYFHPVVAFWKIVPLSLYHPQRQSQCISHCPTLTCILRLLPLALKGRLTTLALRYYSPTIATDCYHIMRDAMVLRSAHVIGFEIRATTDALQRM